MSPMRAPLRHHNSLGLRDEEFILDATPTILFLGDSFVWGLDAEANERFSELLKPRIAGYKILAAGVSGYGTDQEYLLLKKLWPKVKPSVVVLIVCTDNDRQDNSTNIRYEGYQKPYFTIAADGALVLQGQPVPKSRLQAIKEDWWVRHSWLVRLANAVYLKLRYPAVQVPDPTERLVDAIRAFVEGNGSKFMVGLQKSDEGLVRHLQARHIPFVAFDGAAAYLGSGLGGHWTPEGTNWSPSVCLLLSDRPRSSRSRPRNQLQPTKPTKPARSHRYNFPTITNSTEL